MTVTRVTQVVVEGLTQVTPKTRITQVVAESVSQVIPTARISQVVVEVLSLNDPVAGQIKPPPWQRGSVRGNSYLAPRG